MDELKSFVELLQYDHWAGRTALDSIRPLSPKGDAARLALAHLVVTKRVWYCRVAGVPYENVFFPDLTLSECQTVLDEGDRQWAAYLAKLTSADLDKVISYKDSAGNPYERKLRDILRHVILHGQHHRGQVASHVKAAGGTPAKTDFIYYVD